MSKYGKLITLIDSVVALYFGSVDVIGGVTQ